jgi:hypothetical protein
MGIHRSFAIGNDGESFIINLFTNNEIDCEKNTDKETRQDYDLQCQLGKKKFTCEVKFDVYAAKSSNLCIEYHNTKKDKPSGLMATKALLWAHIILDGDNKVAFITSVKKLKEFCEKEVPVKKITSGGDNNANLLLYKCDHILPIFVRVEMLNKEELHKAIKGLLK